MKTIFDQLDNDLKIALKSQLRNLWTYDSTGIEGNTLTLGETKFVIEEGLTVSGKPLKDHNEVIGHANAIELIYALYAKNSITESDLFELHKATMYGCALDIYKPVGAWKREINGTVVVDENKQKYVEYSPPEQVPALMNRWLTEANRRLSQEIHTSEQAIDIYCWLHTSFVRIHPFFDGNGRIARLIANVPIISAGFPPLVISREHRFQYIDLLGKYTLENKTACLSDQELLPDTRWMIEFKKFLKLEWRQSLEILENIQELQKKREKST